MNYAEIIQKQRDYFNSGQTRDIGLRLETLKKLDRVLRLHEPDLYSAIHADFRKSQFDTYANELGLVYHEIHTCIKKVSRWARRKRVPTNLFNLPGRSYIIPEPLGVCLVIGPWNYPYQLSLLPVVSAIAAGNTVLLKPSEIPSASSAAMAKMINENFPPGLIQVIEGGIPETTALLEQKFDKIFFTGSTAVGKIIYQAAAKHLTPVTLELGGKSPAIVTRNANLKFAAKRIIWGKFLNSGQSCIAPDYILAEESVREELLRHFRDYILKYDYALDHDNYVQIINERNFHRLTALLDASKIYHGGKTDFGQRYIEPTLLHQVTFEDKVMEEEIFGPLLPVLSYTDLDAALSMIKSRPKPLACYIFTNDHALRRKILHTLSFGGGTINDTMMHISNNHLPFGGVGESGIGSYHGKTGFDAFSHQKGIIEKPIWGETCLKYPPYNQSKLAWLRRLLG